MVDNIPGNRRSDSKGRLLPLDALRGLIMVLMALDHAAYFIARVHYGEYWSSLPRYDAALPFLVRWVTHVCAPGFFFLMGAGMILFTVSRERMGWPDKRIMRFFIFRGALLILLQFVIVNPVWVLGTLGNGVRMTEPPGGGGSVLFHFGVLFGLGANMILFSLLLRMRSFLIAVLSLISILLTQWLTPSASNADVLYSPLIRMLFIPGHTGSMQCFYPVFPWLGITGLGMLFGRMLTDKRMKVYKVAPVAGMVCLSGFLVLRLVGGFGNFHSPAGGWISFLNVTKYPPSLSFIFLASGICLILITLFRGVNGLLPRIGKPVLIFGRAALFFYVVHLYLYGLIGLAFPGGASYPVMLLFWLSGLLILLPLCRWYGGFKRKKPAESVWRFF
jgi:uncharacterized membrane protein